MQLNYHRMKIICCINLNEISIDRPIEKKFLDNKFFVIADSLEIYKLAPTSE